MGGTTVGGLITSEDRWSTYDATKGRPLAWLLAVVADQGTRHRAKAPVTDRPIELRDADAAAITQLHPADIDLERAIGSLTERQQTALNLYYFVDLDVATIAEVMGCAEGTVKATLHQARGRSRELLGDDHE